ncbi:type IV pili methyl-accepting chemotaxis transducer N-terminal domain-containing protein [Mitsuaria sp. GD03876]|uniref:type IV pili methyl-accepting chemotaxis transducer N-terminal domain-containing protein n=1 Tax=Mitsuaria sp. GD03876 TaxID=2975399 RepID=UPI002446D55C|nr:type IV pili methyl-accepting chemotaxis transducer N-terminal domain-containing protein [Mitsuaria sp. GD03876]MDH0866388.1 type IV pili methyl-accepting chemotaxis transducer N-terminal domain-containing protein [Mitsuaria sp. GD03876]
MSEPAARSAVPPSDDDDALPRRVLWLGADPMGTGPVPHWIAASVHQPGRDSLVRAAQEQAADAVVLHAGADRLEAWLNALEAAGLALPGVGLVPDAADVPAALQQRAMALGLQVLLETEPAPDALRRQLRWAAWQAGRFAALRAQLDDRKWTERAKGLLMAARDLDEDSAFRLLRDAAMHAHLRLGEVARSVVQSAQLAEAVNVAGQQRMLSQRLVKLMAQRAAGIEAKRAKTLQDESCARVAANLSRLPGLLPPLPADAAGLASVLGAWRRLEPLLGGKPSAESLAAADAAAEDLLTHSDALAAAIAGSGGGKPLHVVNLCGRQRMLSQRLAKDALLADLLPGRDPAVLLDSLDRFAAGLAELEASPLSSDAIRSLLAEVGAEWLRLMRSLRDAHGREAAGGLARSSEVLLDRLDLLTGHYQQSLQIILG